MREKSERQREREGSDREKAVVSQYLSKEFGGGGEREKETFGEGVSTRGPRKMREELRHYNNPYFPQPDPHITCNISRPHTLVASRLRPHTLVAEASYTSSLRPRTLVA